MIARKPTKEQRTMNRQSGAHATAHPGAGGAAHGRMQTEGAIALVTGTSRGIGAHLVAELRRRGAARVYAGVRQQTVASEDPRIVPIVLDITNEAEVREAARRCTDVTLLINNAGVNHNRRVIGAPDMTAARAEMEANYFGTLAMCRAFAPVLARNGGGAIVNVLSMAAKVGMPAMGSLSASKAAALRMTECVRAELAGQGTRVIAFMSSAVDTDMTRGLVGVAKLQPEEAARAILDGLAGTANDVYCGAGAARTNRLLAEDPAALARELAAQVAEPTAGR
jgi:NAD(P)-dependent dehydrogenase (short-subunit alcohol dehydrogenase family)